MEINQIEITEDDIRLGVRGNSKSCVIARAANRAFGQDGGCEYSDERSGWYLQRDNKWYEVAGGETVARDFDRGNRIEPAVLLVHEVPCPYEDEDYEEGY